MIEILFKRGDVVHYEQSEYTDYKYDGKCFIVINEMQWVGIYNMDCVEYVEATPDSVPVKEQKPKPEKRQEPKKTSKEFDIGKAKALREGGWTLAGIAKELGCSQQTVANHLRKAGVK